MRVGRNGLFDLVELLVKMNPGGVRAKNIYGNLPIHLLGPATTDGDKARAFLLKEYPEASKVRNDSGRLPIHYACSNGHGPTIRLLVAAYPKGLQHKTKLNGNLPIHLAIASLGS
jgi:ankyrin repeat protein